ncbi:hypothetical protein [Haloprofundus halobius]|nr:hypothetical protein [Haloprofundus halobius]
MADDVRDGSEVVVRLRRVDADATREGGDGDADEPPVRASMAD